MVHRTRIDRQEGVRPAKIASELRQKVSGLGIAIDDDQINRFLIYYNELKVWNSRMNIVSKHSIDEIVTRHFVDSLVSMRYVNRPNGFLIDLGSGGGFPGVPLKIMLPDLNLFLLDSSRKKTSFLSHLRVKLDLNKTEILRMRAEYLLTEPRFGGIFDIVISRAAFKLSELLIWSSYLLRRGGRLIAIKGTNLQKELLDAKQTAAQTQMELNADNSNASSINNHAKHIAIYNRS